MLKEHARFFKSILFLFDLTVIAISWLLAYYLRFIIEVYPAYKGVPPFRVYLALLVPIVVIWGLLFQAMGLYRPKRISSSLMELWDIAKASTLALLFLVSLTFFLRQYEFSRLVFFIFWVLSIISLSFSRVVFRELLRFIRRRGYNLRYALVVGAGHLGQEVAKKTHMRPDLGIKIVGFLTRHPEKVGQEVAGVRVIGTYGEVGRLVRQEGIDQVIIALPWDAQERLVEVLKHLGDEPVDIKVVPDIYQFATLRGGIEELDGLPIVSLQDSPMYGWNRVLKRLMDVSVSALAILILSPLMGIITVIIKLTSPGSVLYRQERMGLDGRVFSMLKFRSMGVDAEAETGPVWAKRGDPRRTKFGALLRRTSVDELPQLFNVLKGDMSLVGPRPERPVFIEEFRKAIPKYMLRHKVKAGITGWAQVNGWRGTTSLEKRIEYDLYYIENWSLVFDLKILWLTLWKGLVSKEAY